MAPGGYSQSYDFLPEFRDKYDQNDDCVNHMSGVATNFERWEPAGLPT